MIRLFQNVVGHVVSLEIVTFVQSSEYEGK